MEWHWQEAISTINWPSTTPSGNPPPPPPVPVPIPIAATTTAATAADLATPDDPDDFIQNRCFAILNCDSLDGPSIFFSQVDCDFYLHSGDGTNEESEYQSFNRVSAAFQYIAPDPEYFLQNRLFVIRNCDALEAPAIFLSETDYNYYVLDGEVFDEGMESMAFEDPNLGWRYILEALPAQTPQTPPTPPPTPPTANAARASVTHAAAPLGMHARVARAELLRTNALLYLGNNVQPVVDKAGLPPSWSAILKEWVRLNFETFRHLSMKQWTNKDQKGRYIKRKTAIEEIERFGATHELSLEQAANLLDKQKKNFSQTVNQHLTYLRNRNPSVATRVQPAAGRRTVPAPPRRRSQAARIERERRQHPPPAVHVRLPPRIPNFNDSFNNSQGLRLRNHVRTAENQQLLRRNAAVRLARLPATADVLLPGGLDRFQAGSLADQRQN